MVKEIIDTTLRDGEQAPGINFSLDEKWAIAEKLIEIGIDEIEAGIPIMGHDQFDFIKYLSLYSKGTRISAWSRLKLDDVKDVYKTGVNTIHISIPVSTYHLPYQLGSWSRLLEKLHEVLKYSSDHFENVSLGFQDSFRTNGERIAELCHIAEDFKAFRIRLSDTVGSAFPSDVKKLVESSRRLFSGKLDFHAHNDLGLATANSLIALESGADSVNVTVNGIGERAGNAALEQIAFVLDMHSNLRSNINLKGVKDLCSKVSTFSKRDIPLDRPIVGSNVFTHESGVHCHGVLNNPLAYQPFMPEDKGLDKEKIVVGTHSGKSNLESVLSSAGIAFSNTDLGEIISKFKREAAEKHYYLTAEEVVEMYKNEHGGRL